MSAAPRPIERARAANADHVERPWHGQCPGGGVIRYAAGDGGRRKPDESYDRIEALCAGPYIELFARFSRLGLVGP